MDIEYLLWLQNFRASIDDALTPFMEWISLFSVRWLILIPAFVYWVIDKRKGLYSLCSYYVCCAVNQIIKLTACIYRPWIRDARVLPAGDAITTATGYSFPSGHTTTAAPLAGGLAVGAWKKYKWISVLCVLLILLVGFSRNYLGVHTPQDVFVGICLSALTLVLVARLFQYIEDHPQKEDVFLLIAFIAGWVGIAYVTFKPYPLDYKEGSLGGLLVDPQKMMNDGYGDIALLVAFPVARYIERRFIRFRAPGLTVAGVITGLVGLVPLYIMSMYMKEPLVRLLGDHWGYFARKALMVLYVIAIYPMVIKAVACFAEKKTSR